MSSGRVCAFSRNVRFLTKQLNIGPKPFCTYSVHAYSTMQRMRGVVVDEIGGPEVLKIKSDLAIPEPKEGQVLVRNAVIGVNYIDM